MAGIENAYNYFLQTYGQSSNLHYDAHKKNDLRNVYNSIVKYNKESPLSKLTNPASAQRFAIDMKEASSAISHVLMAISEDPGNENLDFCKKIATSTNPQAVDVTYNNETSEQPSVVNAFDISVQQLAQPQINEGTSLPEAERSLPSGDFTFEVSTNNTIFEFQFTVHADDDNLGIISRISRLINSSRIGINALVISDGSGNSALRLESLKTGVNESGNIFDISSDGSYNSDLLMDRYGLGNVTQVSAGSIFTLNGEERTSQANKFTINRVFEIELLDETPDAPVTIGFKSDVESIADNVTSLTDAYNELVGVAEKYTNDEPPSTKLYNIISNLSDRYRESLRQIGLNVQGDNTISVDRERLTCAAQSENWNTTRDTLEKFRSSVSNLVRKTSYNPMEFVDRKIVEYKNPNRNFAAPYATSIYAGMMFDAAM